MKVNGRKFIWSSNYGMNPKAGINKWLLINVRGYKKSKIRLYVDGFAKYLNKNNTRDTYNLVSNNFEKWKEFVKTKFTD